MSAAKKKSTMRHISANRHIRKRFALPVIAVCAGLSVAIGLAFVTSVQAPEQEIRFSVASISSDAKGTYPYLPGTDYKFVIVNVAVQNSGEKAFHLAPVIQTYLTDATGRRYDMSPATLDKPLAAGSLASGSRISGELSYSVPVKAKGLTMHFQTDNTEYVYPIVTN